MKRKKVTAVAIVNVLIIAVMVTALIAGNIFAPILTSYLGTVGGTKIDNTSHSAYASVEELSAARAELSYDMMAEGAILLRNERETLPLSAGARVSVFGQHAHEVLAAGSGSGSNGGPKTTVKETLEAAGLTVNPTLWEFYLNNGGKSLGNGPALAGGNSVTDWSINEFPQSGYTDEVKASYESYHDAAVVVISRTGGEGGDLAMDMSPYGGSAEEHYLELCAEEKELLEAVTARFDKVIVLLNTNNPMELGFLEEYDIGACLYIGGVGMSGLDAVGELLVGTISPSGHLTDTYVYDNFSAPATQNFGAFDYENAPEYHYVVYSEGIYVGYRYYETRYADAVMGRENVGTFDYDSVVAYPFGYGLSYTTFAWSDFALHYDEATDCFTAEVTVTNVGDCAGKDVVQLYFSAPYTGAIEKSAVELAAFAKTELLEAGQSETVTLTVSKRDLASYDSQGARTYVLEAGDYYFTVAQNAHEATNSILSAQGYEAGGTDLTERYHQAETDSVSYSVDAYTGTPITNLFDYAQFDGMRVLTRQNWSVMEEGLRYDSLSISQEDLAQAEKRGRDASRNPNVGESVSAPTIGTDATVMLSDMVGADWEDARWETLIQEIGKSDLRNLFATAGYATIEIEKIGKPKTADLDGPGGIQSFVGGASAVEAYGYPTETLMASAWNVELLERFGQVVGEDALATNVSGWYAPGMDCHRSPFGGRNFEYYSEDGYLAGKMGAAVVRGAKEKGLYCYIKHFALNEQDTNRGTALHTWCDEQAMREIYFVPFQISVQEGETTALMTSLACIGTTGAMGNYQLITELLKNEWGFRGLVITDYLAFDADIIEQVLFAGGDGMLSTYGMFNNADDAVYAQLQRAAKGTLYTVANSNAMFATENGAVSAGIPVYRMIILAVELLLAATLIFMDIKTYRSCKREKQN